MAGRPPYRDRHPADGCGPICAGRSSAWAGRFVLFFLCDRFQVREGRAESSADQPQGLAAGFWPPFWQWGTARGIPSAVLKRHQIPMVPKAFAVGFRVEHPQQMINENQYGTGKDSGLLPAAFYKTGLPDADRTECVFFLYVPRRLCGQRLLGRGAAGGQRDERPGQGTAKTPTAPLLSL